MAFGTVGAVAVALIIAVAGERISRIWFHPRLNLEANVRRPDAEMARRGLRVSETEMRDIGFAYFFRLAITNTGNAAARDVQVVLARIEQRVGGRWVEVDRFTPVNLKWSYVGMTTRGHPPGDTRHIL